MNTEEYELDEDLEGADAWLEKEFGRPVEHIEEEPVIRLNYEQFCKQNKYPTTWDSLGLAIEGGSPGNSNKLAKSAIKRQQKLLLDLQCKVKAGLKAYDDYLISNGFEEIPYLEQLKSKAKGHPDNASVQAAIRLLKKKGISI